MKLSRTVSYALQATLQLAQSDSSGPIPCSRLAAQGKMPERFLLQILRIWWHMVFLDQPAGWKVAIRWSVPPRKSRFWR